jgi:hypothetical protein
MTGMHLSVGYTEGELDRIKGNNIGYIYVSIFS